MNSSHHQDKNNDSDGEFSQEIELLKLRHENEILKLQNKTLENQLQEKEKWHHERGLHLDRLLKEKEGFESRVNFLLSQSDPIQPTQNKKPSLEENWDRRKGDSNSKEIKTLPKTVENKKETSTTSSITKTDPVNAVPHPQVSKETSSLETTLENAPNPVDKPIEPDPPKKQYLYQSAPKNTPKLKKLKSLNSTTVVERDPVNVRIVLFTCLCLLLALATIFPTPLKHHFVQKEVFFYQSMMPSQKANDNIKLVLITKDDISQIGRWPWPRNVMAIFHEYLSQVCKAKTIVYDILYTEPSVNEQEDREFIEVINEKDNVLLAATIEPGIEDHISPITDPFSLDPISKDLQGVKLPITGLFRSDTIGVVNTNTADRQRLVPIFFNVNGSYLPNLSFRSVLHFGDVEQRMFDYQYEKSLAIKAWQEGQDRVLPLYNKNEFLVTPYDSIDQFENYSFTDLFSKIEKDEPIDAIQDSLVFIGLHDGVSDIHKNARGRNVPGVLFHAGIASDIMNGDFIKPIPSELYLTSLLAAIFLSIILGNLCNRYYLLRSIVLQHCLFTFVPLCVLMSLSYAFYTQGEPYRTLSIFTIELAFLLPICVFKIQKKVFKVEDHQLIHLDQNTSLQFTLLSQAPRPMALAYERHLQVTSDTTQHASTVFEERVVRFLGLMHLAVLHQSGGKVDEKFIQYIKNDTNSFQKPLAAGTCIGFSVYVRKTLKAAGDVRFFKPQAPNAFRDSFLKERQAGGHYDLGQKDTNHTGFEEWLTEYWNYNKHRLFVYLGQEVIDEKLYFVYENLSGVQRLGKQRILSELELHLNHVYLMNDEGTLIDLYPFLLYRPYEQTQAKELLEFYQMKGTNDVLYQSLDGSETVEVHDSNVLDIIQSFKTVSAQKKELLHFSELRDLYTDHLKPYSKGDHLFNKWRVSKELSMEKGTYWYEGESLQVYMGKRKKVLLNFYLKETEAYQKLELLKKRLNANLDASYIWKPIFSAESDIGYWVIYDYAEFCLETEYLPPEVLTQCKALLFKFHDDVGVHHAISSKSFLKPQENPENKVFILPGSEPQTFGQQGSGLARMIDKLKEKELKRLDEI